MHIALQTEYSFKKCYLHIGDIHKYVVDGRVGIADINNTYGHILLSREAEKHGFTPIYGVRLHVLPDESVQRVCNQHWVFIAKNNEGLREIYSLVERAYDNFYYIPKLKHSDIHGISKDVYVIAPNKPTDRYLEMRVDYFAKGQGYGPSNNNGIAIDVNNFPSIDDRETYELLAGARKNGSGYSYNFTNATYPQHILSRDEWLAEYKDNSAMIRANYLGGLCNATIPKADMVTWKGDTNLLTMCCEGMVRVKEWTDEYEDRLKYELGLIKDKGYEDYFLIVADMIQHAKKTMLVGPSRGSSAGSLVCYLLGITEVNPIEHKLIFERFIDINRFDLPDIDIDFPDRKRDTVIKYIKHKYKKSNVMCLANINKFKAKSAIGEFAKSLGIPSYETSGVKDAIIERSSGDARAAMCITDTFETTEPGKDFIGKYPKMALVQHIENHATHAGKHAAGILVSTLPLCNYGSINNRDDVIMIDRWGAEHLGLLKIDCLGLRTLSVLEGVADQIGMDYKEFYDLPLDDPAVFIIFNSMRLSGIFQFEGQALQTIVKQMGVNDFNDIAAITALARPGALNSGGTARYIKYSTGAEEPKYYSDVHREITQDTYGIVVYQEQMMEIARRIGGMSWENVSTLRKASSKSYGDEFFGKFKNIFMEGALDNGYEEAIAEQIWVDISASGSWTFNKSHAVSYGLVSYWTAWCKSHYPMEFAVSSLNNAANTESAVKLLRDMVINEKIEYVAVDPDKSDINWTHKDGKLIGGLTNLKGIGLSKARSIMAARKGGKALTPSLYKKLMNPETDFDIIFPARHYWGNLYDNPMSIGLLEKPVEIIKVDGRGEFMFIGCLVDRNLRDLNEHVFLTKRGGELETEHTQYLNFRVEDDTDMISCNIDRYHYESIGRVIAETGRLGKDWFLIKGRIQSDWRRVKVTEIINLNEYFKVKI